MFANEIFNYIAYIDYLSRKTNIVIITGNLTGGSLRWLNDLGIMSKKNVSVVDDKKELIELINKFQKKCVIILQSFLRTNIGIKIIFKLKKKFDIDLILPIHDWYWFNHPFCKKYKKKYT